MFRSIAIGVLTIAGTFSIARADVYRWVDEQGVAHYSDQSVPGSELIKTNKPHPFNADADAQRRADEQKKPAAAGNQASNQPNQQAAAKAVKEDVAKVRAEQCKKATERYQQAIHARRIYKSTNGGEDRDYMSDEEADAYRLKTRNEVQDLCGSVPPPTD
jgi:Domain of unknown function (DUF4124)